MPDTLAANIAETYNEIIQATVELIPHKSLMPGLVTRIIIPKGHHQVEIPRINSTSSVQTPTEGDEIVSTSQFDLTSTTINPTLRAVYIRVSGRAEYFSGEDTVAMVSKELAQTQGQDMDTDLLAEFANFGSGNDVGTTNTDLTLAVLRNARRLLAANTRANGGPAPMPLYLVLAPIPEENLFTNLGLQGVVSSTSPWVPSGLSQDLIENYYRERILGVPMFVDGYMTEDSSSDFICGMFSKGAMHLAISKDWTLKVFEESNWIGPILRSVADYNSGIGSYPLWGSQITTDGA